VAFLRSQGDEEAVFSSSEDRIRAGRAVAEVVGPSIVLRHSFFGSVRRCTLGAAESLFSIFFPSDCRLCARPLLNISRLPVCPDCLGSIRPITSAVCSICGETVLSSYARCDDDGLRRCPACRRIDRPFHRAVAYGSYEAGLRELIHLLKFSGVRPAANFLGSRFAETLTSLQPKLEQPVVLILPVPLYKAKLRQRGFNQAELIATAALQACPNRTRFRLDSGVLARVRDTHSQIGLSSHQRRENLRGAFTVVRAPEVNGREVLLVDDVYTTGTTASECARVLRKAGASRVWVATVARTLKLASKYEEQRGFLQGPDSSVSEFQEGNSEAESPENLGVLETLKL
jgi:ComF family protein